MFKRPNSLDDQYVLADFLELECLKAQTEISSLSYRSLLSISDDEIDNNGIESSDDLSVEKLDTAIDECYNRSLCCPNQYPFITGRSSLNLKSEENFYKDIYTFLLLATRLNMNKYRNLAGYDGTELFENLCAIVTKEYFGGHAIAEVFGASIKGSFRDKVTNLIKKLHLRGQFKEPEGSTRKEKDGNLDIIAWIPFSDKKDGQMIALGQCKTGTNWEGMLTELNPDIFFSLYSTQSPYNKPLKLFFVTESFGNYKWQERCSCGGILFDRTRIMEFLPSDLDEQLVDKIKKWNSSAISIESYL